MIADNLELLKIRYRKEQRVFIVEQYFKNNEGNFHTKYNQNSDLTSSTVNVKRLIKKFRENQLVILKSGCLSTSR